MSSVVEQSDIGALQLIAEALHGAVEACLVKIELRAPDPSQAALAATSKRRGLMSGSEPSSDMNASPAYVAE
jgi:hypothetical protein